MKVLTEMLVSLPCGLFTLDVTRNMWVDRPYEAGGLKYMSKFLSTKQMDIYGNIIDLEVGIDLHSGLSSLSIMAIPFSQPFMRYDYFMFSDKARAKYATYHVYGLCPFGTYYSSTGGLHESQIFKFHKLMNLLRDTIS